MKHSLEKPSFVIERWAPGWLLCGSSGFDGRIPVSALAECETLFGERSVCLTGVAHHYRESGRYACVLAVATEQDAQQWERAIEESLSSVEPQERWWRGLRVGLSSAAIFAVFAEEPWAGRARMYSAGAVPRDSSDFGRCTNLLKEFPEWRGRLQDVAARYPATLWPNLVARWDEIEAAEPKQQTAILQTLSTSRPNPAETVPYVGTKPAPAV